MSEPTEQPSSPNKIIEPSANGVVQKIVTLFIVLGLLGLFLFLIFHFHSTDYSRATTNTATVSTSLPSTSLPSTSLPSTHEFEARLDAMNERLNALEAKNQSNTETLSSSQKIEDKSSHDSNLDALRQELTTLSSRVDALDRSVQSSGTLTALQAEEQKSLKETLAYLSLREAAFSGHAFESELQSMRNATKENSTLNAEVNKLQNASTHGIHTLAQLSEEFIDHENSLLLIMKRSSAENWHDKLWAELSSLVTIRPLHGQRSDGPAAVMTDIENKLSSDDLARVLDDIQLLPSETKGPLEEWRQAVDDRYAVESVLKDIGSQLATAGDKGSP